MNFKLIFYTCFAVLLMFSCSSTKSYELSCKMDSEYNYFIKQRIDKKEVNSLSSKKKSRLKEDLISQISTSVKTESKVFISLVDENSSEFFGSSNSNVSYGYLKDPVITYCRDRSGFFVLLSISKKDFNSQSKNQLENELDINLKTLYSVLRNYDSSKQTFNNQQSKKFNIKSQELISLHSLVVNESNYSRNEINEINDKLALFQSYTNELSKKSYVFDNKKRLIDKQIKSGLLKSAFLELNILLNTYGKNSNEGVEIMSILNGLSYEIKDKWNTEKRGFNKNISKNNLSGAKYNLKNLYNLTINSDYVSEYNKMDVEYLSKSKEIEKEDLLSKSTKNGDFYFGINAGSSYGNINNSGTSISLDSDASNFNFDKILPSFKIGYRYLFNPVKRIGLFVQYKSHTEKHIEINSNSEYVFPFQEKYNEVQIGFSASVFDLSYGEFIDPIVINNQEVNFKTLSLNMSILTTDNLDRGKRNYFHLYTGFNLITDTKDINYLNIIIGLNYHIRFNRKLSKEDRRYLSSN